MRCYIYDVEWYHMAIYWLRVRNVMLWSAMPTSGPASRPTLRMLLNSWRPLAADSLVITDLRWPLLVTVKLDQIDTGYDDVIRWKHFPRYRPFVRGIHWSSVNSPHKGQALMFSLICAWTNGWVKNRAAGDLRRHRAHYDVTALENLNFIIKILFWLILKKISCDIIQNPILGISNIANFTITAIILKIKSVNLKKLRS